MPINSSTQSNKFKEIVSAKSGDFKKIINKAINDPATRNDNMLAFNVINAKCSMDYFEDMNIERAKDGQ